MISRFLGIIFAVLLFITGNMALAKGSELIYEKTYVIKSRGMDMGYVHVFRRRQVTAENVPVIVTKKHIEQKFKRQNDEIQIVQDQIFVEDESGKPVQFSFTSKNNGENTKIRGDFDWSAGEIIVNTEINDIEELKIMDLDEKILFPYAIDRLYRETEDDRFKYFTLEPGVNLQVIKIKAERLGRELLQEGNLDGVYRKYRKKADILPNTVIYSWRDKDGHVVKEYSSLLDITQFEVDKDDILDIPSEFDIYSESIIKVDKNIADVGAVNQAIYKISLSTPVENAFITDELQKIIQIKDNTVYLKVDAGNYENYKFSYPIKKTGYEKYLKSGPFIITDSKKIQDLAKSLAAEENDALQTALKMRKWVYENITNKNFAFDMANAVKVLETKSGDCTEHSILLASLLRAAGIPAKIVVGLVYTDSPEPSFMYHMWVKVFVGKWINIDPSLPYDNFTPLHIAIAESPLNSLSAKSELVLNIISSFSKMDIEILNVSKSVVSETGGKPEVKVNLKSKNFLAGNNLVRVKIDKFQPSKADIQEIQFPQEEENNNIKEAFYNFTKGDTEKALAELKNYYATINPDDNFLKMKLTLKLINMSYFNFARQVINEVGDREIWDPFINELYTLYFPKKFFPDDREKIQYTAFYALNYGNDPDFVLELTQNIHGYDYIHYLRAQAFSQKKDFKEAEKEITRAIEIHPKNLTYNLEKISILSDKNDIIKAQQMLNYVNLIAKKNNINNKEFWKRFKSYDYWLKVKQFRENIVLSKYYEAYYYLVKGETGSAINILSRLAKGENVSYVYELLAEAYYEIDQLEAAQKYYKKALLLDENSVKSNLGLGNVYFLYENQEKAEEYYQKILRARPENVEALLAMAKLNIYLGNKDKALDYFKKILTIDRENTDVLYNIGVILANRGNYQEAEKMLKKVLSTAPMSHHEIWLDLAKIQLITGSHTDAVKSLKNVNYLDEENPYYYYFMGVLLKEKGNSSEANKYFKKGFNIEPNLIDR